MIENNILYNNKIQSNNKFKRWFTSNYFKIFALGFGVAFIMFLPSLIFGQGVFTFFGDYVVQQIPFYKHCHQMVTEGNLFWDWGTDLGVNFIGSYSFYLLGSPFFWLTIPFPNHMLPYLMAPLFFLKFATASLTSYAFIQRFVKNKNYAMIGALLYAFSSFNIYNIFFNHFHDVVAFFPLLLIGLEELVVNNRKGPFALAVFLNATINYFFFAGQITFLILYFFARFAMCREWKITFRKFLCLAFESVIGVALSCVILLPAIFAIIDNPRIDSSLSGYSMFLYSNEQRYPAILSSFLFPSELPSRPLMFTDHNAKWSSMAGWMPLFSLSGVFAYCLAKKRSWIKSLIILLSIMAFIPVFNSAFFAFNAAYYARWYYMPILIMALATVKCLDDPKIDFLRGIKWTFSITAVIAAIVGLTPVIKDGETKIGLSSNFGLFISYAIIALVSLVIVYLLIKYLRNKQIFFRAVSFFTVLVIIVTGVIYIAQGRAVSSNHEWIANDLVETQLVLDEDPDDTFFRTDFPSSFDNLGMYWGYPQLTTFHSIVPRSITDFYTALGVKRSVGSRPETTYHGIRALTSVKYYFQNASKSNDVMPGYEYIKTQNGVKLLENKYFIPMGFTYDKYMTTASYNNIAETDKDKAFLKAIYLSPEQIKRHKDILSEAPLSELKNINTDQYFIDCTERQKTTCSSFERDNNGFTAKINLDKDNLVFFSVPYEKGWSATVNGEKVDIEKVNVGFMAVRVGATNGGEAVIRFNYQTPWLNLGLIISSIGLILFAIYMIIYFLDKRSGRIIIKKCSCCGRCEDDGNYINPVVLKTEQTEQIEAKDINFDETQGFQDIADQDSINDLMALDGADYENMDIKDVLSTNNHDEQEKPSEENLLEQLYRECIDEKNQEDNK